MASDIEAKVANWIRADYEFRFGSYAFSQDRQDWLVRAERELREALTGEGTLRASAQALGVDTDARESQWRGSKTAKKKKKGPKKRKVKKR